VQLFELNLKGKNHIIYDINLGRLVMISESAKKEIERLRKRSLFFERLSKLVKKSIPLLFVIMVVGLFFCMASGKNILIAFVLLMGTYWCTAIMAMILEIVFERNKKEFKTLYKREFVKGILETQFDNLEYVAEEGFSRAKIRDFQLVYLTNKVFSEDYIKSEYKGVMFEQSDITMRKQGGGHVNPIHFKGRMLRLPNPCKNVEDIQIFSRNFNHRAPRVSGQAAIYVNFLGKDVMNSGQGATEDADFDKRFDVYSVNEQDVNELLTPAFREKLKKIDFKYDAVAFRFKGDELYIALSSKRDFFECSEDKPIQYEEEKKQVIANINEIKYLIETLSGGC